MNATSSVRCLARKSCRVNYTDADLEADLRRAGAGCSSRVTYWTPERIAKLRHLWTTRGRRAAIDGFPDKSGAAIEQQAFRCNVGPAYRDQASRKTVWTPAKIALLRRLWPTATRDDLARAFPGQTFSSLRNAKNDYAVAPRQWSVTYRHTHPLRPAQH